MLCVRRDFSPADKNAADEHFGPLGFASCPLPGFLRNLSRLHPWTRDDPPRDKLKSQPAEVEFEPPRLRGELFRRTL